MLLIESITLTIAKISQKLFLTRWVPYDGYIRHQIDHLSGRMTDISIIGEWQVSGVGGTGHSGMFWARLTRDDFRSKLKNIFLLSRVMFISKRFFVSPRFCKIWRQTFESCGFWFRRCLSLLLKISSVIGHLFANSYDLEYFEITFLFSKQSRCYFPDSYGDPQAERSILAMVRQKLEFEWKLHFPVLTRSSAEEPSIIAIGTSRLRWSMVQKRKKHKEVSVWLCEVTTFHHLQTSEFWRTCFQDPMSLPFCTSLFSCKGMYRCKSVRLQCGDSEENQSSVTLPVLITGV